MLDNKYLPAFRSLFQHTACVDFSKYMAYALYHPTDGYYMNPGVFGSSGDFVTAPMLSRVLAQCIVKWLDTQGVDKVLEIAPGNGKLASQIMKESKCIDSYYLLDKNNLASQHLAADKRFHWLSDIPENFDGAIIANEWLDALPFRRFCWSEEKGLEEFMVALNDGMINVILEQRDSIKTEYPSLLPYMDKWPSPYLFEHHDELWGVLSKLSSVKGPVLLIDYGYEEEELYHPDRNLGTMICVQKHQVVPFSIAETGRMDITAAVNWTRVKAYLYHMGFSLENFGPQADFVNAYWDQSQKLDFNSPVINHFEMGQYIKVLAMRK